MTKIETKNKQPNKVSTWSGGKLLWGSVMITVGIVTLLGNLGVMRVDLLALLQLWPLIIVIAGLSVLAFKGFASKLIYMLTTILIIGLIIAVATGSVGAPSDLEVDWRVPNIKLKSP